MKRIHAVRGEVNKMPHASVIVFPGSNCDRDVKVALEDAGFDISMAWHAEGSLPDATDVVVLPGGFSYGDYLRCGAMAGKSLIMKDVKNFAAKGRHVLGICNGFQILCETGLLPGILMRNADLKFTCRPVDIRVEHSNSAFTSAYAKGDVISIPIANHDGNYFADQDTLTMLEAGNQIAFRYSDAEGTIDRAYNPNGSVANIAGIYNTEKNVLGLMPHPERHADANTGGIDGKSLFSGLLESLK